MTTYCSRSPHDENSVSDSMAAVVGNHDRDQGQPDLLRVDLKIQVQDKSSLAGDNLDLNSNASPRYVIDNSKIIVTQLASNLVDKLGEMLPWSHLMKNSLKIKVAELVLNEIKDDLKLVDIEEFGKHDANSRFLKPSQFGWSRKVMIGSIDMAVSYVVYLTPEFEGKRLRIVNVPGMTKFLKVTCCGDLQIGNFCFEKKVLGLDNFEIVKKAIDCFMDPLQFGWLRNVTVRPSDQKVTGIGYETPPDSEGRRQRFKYKKDIEVYLHNTNNNELGVEHFCIVRKVLGFPAEFEVVRSNHRRNNYSREHILKAHVSKNYKEKNLLKETADNDSSYDTLDDNSSSSASEDSSDVSTLSDCSTDDNSNDSFDHLVRDSKPSPLKSEPISLSNQKPLITSSPSKKLALVTSKTITSQNSYPPNIPISNVATFKTVNPSSSQLSISTEVSSFPSTDAMASMDITAKEPVSDKILLNPRSTASCPNPTMSSSNLHSTMPSHTQPSDSSCPNLLPWSNQIPNPQPSLRCSPNPQPSVNSSPNFPPSVSSFPIFQTSVNSFQPSVSRYPNLQPIVSSCLNLQTSTNICTNAMATVLMVSTGGREGSRKHLKMSIKSGVMMVKGMKKFGAKFGLDFRKLKFYSNDQQLTGEELAGELDGVVVKVDGVC